MWSIAILRLMCHYLCNLLMLLGATQQTCQIVHKQRHAGSLAALIAHAEPAEQRHILVLCCLREQLLRLQACVQDILQPGISD